MKIFYFTATGNNLYVAKSFEAEYYSIPKLLKENNLNFEDDKIGIVFPVYHSGVPKIVEEFLDKAKLKSNYFFGIATYGMYAGASTIHLLKIGERNGIKFSYVNELIMVDNYLPGFDMDKQIKTQSKKNIEGNLNKIIEDVTSNKIYLKKHSKVSEIVRSLNEKLYDPNFDKKFIVDDSCISCRICEKVCPVNNITVATKPKFNGNCQHCLACIQNCPKKAIKLKNQKSDSRFINEHVTLKEIIDSNN